VYARAFSLGLIELMTIVIVLVMAMAQVIVLVIVIVIIVPEVFRKVGWLLQRQHQSFYRLGSFY
jgi:hypothetical protein